MIVKIYSVWMADSLFAQADKNITWTILALEHEGIRIYY